MKDRSNSLGPRLRAWVDAPGYFDRFFSFAARIAAGLRRRLAPIIPLSFWDWTAKQRKKTWQPTLEKLENRVPLLEMSAA
jgi:hypothetical protein